MSPLEIAANGITTVSILLAGRNSVHTWWTGLVGCVLFAVVFGQSRLYADVVLQSFFVVTSVIGWWQWLRGDHGHALSVERAPRWLFAVSVPLGIAAAAGYGTLLYRFTDAYAPFADSAILVFSVIAQVLLMRRCIEAWPFWLVVNLIAVPVYASRGLHLTAVLYFGYLINAVVSWRHWHRLAPGEATAADERATA